MPTKITDNSIDKVREQNRARAKKYYEAHKAEITEKRKLRRTGEQPPPPPPPRIVENNPRGYKLLKKGTKIIKIQGEKTIDINTAKNAIKENPKISGRNQEANISSLNQVFRGVENLAPYVTSKEGIDDLEKHLNTLQKKDGSGFYNSTSKRNFVMSVINTLRSLKLDEQNGYLENDLWDLYRKYKGDNTVANFTEPTLEHNNKKPVPNFHTYISAVLKKYGNNSLEYVFVKMYFQIPLRGEYPTCVYVKSATDASDKTKNYIVIPDDAAASVVLNNYKTDARYGEKTHYLNDVVSKLLREYVKTKREGTKIFKDFKIKAVADAVKIPMIDVNTMRKSVASTKYFIDGQKSREEITQLCDIMGHTLQVHLESYIMPILQ